jgi:hypothetical protein
LLQRVRELRASWVFPVVRPKPPSTSLHFTLCELSVHCSIHYTSTHTTRTHKSSEREITQKIENRRQRSNNTSNKDEPAYLRTRRPAMVKPTRSTVMSSSSQSLSSTSTSKSSSHSSTSSHDHDRGDLQSRSRSRTRSQGPGSGPATTAAAAARGGGQPRVALPASTPLPSQQQQHRRHYHQNTTIATTTTTTACQNGLILSAKYLQKANNKVRVVLCHCMVIGCLLL